MHGVSVRIDSLTKQYGSFYAIRDVSLEVEAGEFVALLGPSGSGKSTILMSIAGFSQPSSGKVLIGGNDVTTLAPRHRNIGMVFQKYALFPHMTVERNIAFPLLQRGLDRTEIRSRIDDVASLVGMKDLLGRPVPTLSGGQQQRVALARALVFEPPVLLMDEPLGALDKKMRERLQVEIKEIQRVTGTTVLFVTHDQSEALSMADRLVVLNHGVIEQTGSPETLYNAPANAFVADFIGEANILRGELASMEQERCTVRLSNGEPVVGKLIGESHKAGQAVDLVIRPASVSLREVADSQGLVGEVVSTSFLGDALSVRIQLSSGDVITVRDLATSERRRGQKLSVSWEHHDARVFRSHDSLAHACDEPLSI